MRTAGRMEAHVNQATLAVSASSCCLVLAVAAAAQPARTPPIESPVVHPDRE
jgi:hypothetical protein